MSVTELHAHPIPSDTSLTDDTREALRSVSLFYDRHRVAITVSVIVGISLLINRAIMRRELKHITFSIDIYPDGSLGDSWMGEE